MSTVKTKLVRFIYCHLAEPHDFAEGQDAKYSVNVLIDKDDKETLNRILKGYQEAVQDGVEDYGASFKAKATPLKREPESTRGLKIQRARVQEQIHASDKEYQSCICRLPQERSDIRIQRQERNSGRCIQRMLRSRKL